MNQICGASQTSSRRDGAPDSLVDLRTQENTYAQQRQNIAQTFDLQKRSVRAETDREDTEQQEKMAVATSDRAQKTTTAFEAQDVILTKARSDLEVAEFTGRTEKAELVEKTKIECARRVRTTKKECSVETTQSEALREASKDLAAAREAEAAGEGKAAEYQEERIRFEQQKRLAAIDAHFAARGRHVIQGEGGRQLLSAFHDGRGVQASMMKRD